MFKNKFKDSDTENKYCKFIWGVLSADEPLNGSANLYTNNDIEIVYFKKIKKYSLSINTAFIFSSYKEEKEYLESCLKALDSFMDKNGYNKEEPFTLFLSTPALTMSSFSIEHLYTQFKIFVDGY